MNATSPRDPSLPGVVYLVGAGPGAPDLVTVRAARVLARADIVFHDALVHPDTLALATHARFVSVGKRAGRVSTDQRFIDRALVEAARHHAVVVRLKGGDPSLFSRAAEEIDALRAAGIRFEIVPGVTAALAAAAELKLPLTRRGVARNVSFATLRHGRGELPRVPGAGARPDTLMLYMAAGEAAATQATLRAMGYPADTPVVIAENVSLPEASSRFATVGTLTDLPLRGGDGPVLIGVGAVFRTASARSGEDDAAAASG